jgi:hypothetical protein
MSDPHRPRVSHYDCPEVTPGQEAKEDEEARAEHKRLRARARRALEGFLRYDSPRSGLMVGGGSQEHRHRQQL